MKKYLIITASLVLFLSSCSLFNHDEFKEAHTQAKTNTEFVIGLVEFQSIQFKIKAYGESMLYTDDPHPQDQQGTLVLVNTACEKKIGDLNQQAKSQFLSLCKVATTKEQFAWVFKNRTIINEKTMVKALLNNQNFTPDSIWITFLCQSGAVKNIWALK